MRATPVSVIGGLLLTSILVPLNPARADREPDEFENITPTADLNGPSLVSGTLAGEGASVRVYAVSPDGPMVPASVGRVDGSSFDAVAEPSVDLTDFVNDSGVVDFTIVASTDDKWGVWSFSRKLDATGEPVPEPVRTNIVDVEGGAGGESVTENVVVPLQWEKGDTPATTQISYCGPVLATYQAPVHVGQAYHWFKAVKSTFSYKIGSDSELGVGVAAPGGRWSLGGKVTRSATGAYGVSWTTRDHMRRYLDTVYEYKKRRCFPMFGADYYEVKPDRHLGGATSRTVSHVPSAKYCVPHERGTQFALVETRATAWSNGVRLGFVSLWARSGYTRDVAIHARFYHGRHVCGVNDYPGSRSGPGQIVYGRNP